MKRRASGTPISEEERRLLDEAMSGVRRIESSDVRPRPDPPEIVVRGATSAPPPPLVVEAGGEQVKAFDPGVTPAVRRALARGDIEPDATIDLHGLHAAAARLRVEAAVTEARAAGRRCLLLITGRGLRSGPEGPVLRDVAVEALARKADQVIGFTTAPAPLGGAGALLVLLRRTRS